MMHTQDPLVLVFSRNAFYRRMHFLALGAFLLSVIVIIILSGVLYFLVYNPTKPIYFATDSLGRLIKVVPVTEPNMSTAEVGAWAIEAVQAAFSYDYVNYPAQLQAAQKYFTNYGWAKYMKSLTQSNNLNSVTTDKTILLGQVVEAPRLIAQGILSGAYAWKFQLPMLATLWKPPYDDTTKIRNSWLVTVVVQRQPILQSYKGLGIVQVIAEQGQSLSPQVTPSSPNAPASSG